MCQPKEDPRNGGCAFRLLPARYPPIPIDYIAPNLHVTVAGTPVRIKAHVDDINGVGGFFTVALSDDEPLSVKGIDENYPMVGKR